MMTPTQDRDDTMVRVTLRLPEDLHAWLSERSTDEEVSLNRLIVKAVEQQRIEPMVRKDGESFPLRLAEEVEQPAFRLEEIERDTDGAAQRFTAVVDGVALGYLDIVSVADSLTRYEEHLGYRPDGIFPLLLSIDNRFSILAHNHDELWRWCWFLAQAVAVGRGKPNHAATDGESLHSYPPPLPPSEYGACGTRYQAVLSFQILSYDFDDSNRPDGQVGTEDRIVSALTECTRVLRAWGCTDRVIVHSIHSIGGDQLPNSITHFPEGTTEADFGALGHVEVEEGMTPFLNRVEVPEKAEACQTRPAVMVGDIIAQGLTWFVASIDGEQWLLEVQGTIGQRGGVPIYEFEGRLRSDVLAKRSFFRATVESLYVMEGLDIEGYPLTDDERLEIRVAQENAETISWDSPTEPALYRDDRDPDDIEHRSTRVEGDEHAPDTTTIEALKDAADEALDLGVRVPVPGSKRSMGNTGGR
jgi:hypothetical protein